MIEGERGDLGEGAGKTGVTEEEKEAGEEDTETTEASVLVQDMAGIEAAALLAEEEATAVTGTAGTAEEATMMAIEEITEEAIQIIADQEEDTDSYKKLF